MTDRRPLVLLNGKPAQIPDADAILCPKVKIGTSGPIYSLQEMSAGGSPALSGVMIRDVDNTEMKDFGCNYLLTNGIVSGDRLQTIATSINKPNSPESGDLWLELDDFTLRTKYGWWWEWSGSYWLSPQVERLANYDDINSTRNREWDCEQSLDYFFERILANGTVATTNSGSSVWGFYVERLNSANAVVQMLTTSSTGWAVGAGSSAESATGVHVDVSAVGAKRIRATAQKNATAGNFNGSIKAVFRYARP